MLCVVRQCESDVSSVTCACARIRACVRESVAVGCVVCLTVSVLFLSATILTRPCYHLPRRRPRISSPFAPLAVCFSLIGSTL